MRKICSILLLTILTFNWVGYRLYIAVMEHHAEQSLIDDLDNNRYAADDLISVKIAAPHLAYYEVASDFVRINGHIEMNGIQYNYVKRRLIHDSLEFLCIPNAQATRLKTAKDEFFKLVNDLHQTGRQQKQDQHNKAFKLLNEKYFPVCAEYISSLKDAQSPALSKPYILYLPSACISVAGQPPECT